MVGREAIPTKLSWHHIGFGNWSGRVARTFRRISIRNELFPAHLRRRSPRHRAVTCDLVAQGGSLKGRCEPAAEGFKSCVPVRDVATTLHFIFVLHDRVLDDEN